MQWRHQDVGDSRALGHMQGEHLVWREAGLRETLCDVGSRKGEVGILRPFEVQVIVHEPQVLQDLASAMLNFDLIILCDAFIFLFGIRMFILCYYML